MIRINCFSGFLSGMIGLTAVFSGCTNHDKAVVSGPVRVDVEVAGGTSGRYTPGKTYSGTIESADESVVSFSVPGTISKIYVEEGQKVAKGQLLAKVKSESLINSRNIAQATLEEARDAYARMKKLHDADALPDIRWVEIQSTLKQAENAAALADRAVEDASIHSPIAGYISQKLANDGQTVVPAEPVLKVVSLDKLQAAISVPENEISAFTDGTTATVTLEAAGGITATGKTGQKNVVADPLTRSYTVKFDIDNPGGKILPGMIGTVAVDGLSTPGAVTDIPEVTLPSQAVLLSADNRQFVWLVKEGKAVRRFVTADELTSDGVKVKSGIAAGDSVIVAGMQKVSTGTPVTVAR